MSKDNTNIVLEINDASKNITSMDSVEENLSNNILVMLNPKQTPLEQYKEMLDQYQEICEKLNKDIGFYWWKRYVSAAFWANLSTPFNLAITLITALTTGQAATKDLISQTATLNLSISALIISTINTFFRPHDQMNEHLNQMKEWSKFGGKFDTIYYKPDDTMTQLGYKNNFFTDLIHVISKYGCLMGKKEFWIPSIQKDFKKKQTQLTICLQ